MDTIEQHGWEPLAWQDYINQILLQHFCLLGHTYQRVADGVNGDGDLEGFSSNGDAYQACSDQNSNSKAERLKTIKDKITDDLPKLIKYKSEWISRLGDIKLKFWTLVIPLYEDKDLITHALRKAKLVREANLPFIARKFRA